MNYSKAIFLTISFSLMVFFWTKVNAQKSPIEFGKIDISDMEIANYPVDTSAAAIILSDFGINQLKYYEQTGFQLEFLRHVRIKILKKEGYDWANVEIPLYKSGNDKEKVVSLKGITYNVVDGEIEKVKFSKKELYTEEKNQYWDIEKFTMPNVHIGSVIEYQYVISSDFFFNFNDWYFQYTIPVKRSEYWVKIPEYFTYNKSMRGYVLLKENSLTNETTKMTITEKSRTNDSKVTKTEFDYQKIEFFNSVYHYVAEDLPAIKQEPLMPHVSNYFPRIEFELAYIQFPNHTRKEFTNTWEDINYNLMKDPEFGTQLNRANYAGDFIETLQPVTDSLEKALAIFEFVKKKMKWNKINSIYVTTTLRDAYALGSGSSADINIMLTALLIEAGLNARPVLISTRNHGFILLSRPSIDQFNYVISMVTIDGKEYLFDATDPYCPADILPERCINQKGRIIDKNTGGWVGLDARSADKKIIQTTVELDDQGTMTGKIGTVSYGYAAYDLRNKLKQAESQKDFIAGIESKYPGLQIEEFTIENADDVNAELKLEYIVTIEDNADPVGDLIYFSPIFYGQIDDNPFKLDEREYPIDFIYPSETTISSSYKIPEEYAVESIPENTAFKLPDNGGIFRYSINQFGDLITVTSVLQISKTWFSIEEYPPLKQFMSLIVAKHAEQIVLKKK